MSSVDENERPPYERVYGVPYIPYPVDRIQALSERLITTIRLRFGVQACSGRDFQELVGLVRSVLPASVSSSAVYDSLRGLVGRPLTSDLVELTGRRLAGNLPALVRGVPVATWQLQRGHEWVPLQITSIMPKQRKRGLTGAERSSGMVGGIVDRGAELTARILAGSPAGLLTRWWLLARSAARFATRLGFSDRVARRQPYPFYHPGQLVNLRFCALMDPKRSERGPGFLQAFLPTSYVAWNRRLLLFRYRRDQAHACPHGYPQEHACETCPIGYLHCRAGTHRQDYQYGPCISCGREQAPFDPDWPSDRCVRCRYFQECHDPNPTPNWG